MRILARALLLFTVFLPLTAFADTAVGRVTNQTSDRKVRDVVCTYNESLQYLKFSFVGRKMKEAEKLSMAGGNGRRAPLIATLKIPSSLTHGHPKIRGEATFHVNERKHPTPNILIPARQIRLSRNGSGELVLKLSGNDSDTSWDIECYATVTDREARKRTKIGSVELAAKDSIEVETGWSSKGRPDVCLTVWRYEPGSSTSRTGSGLRMMNRFKLKRLARAMKSGQSFDYVHKEKKRITLYYRNGTYVLTVHRKFDSKAVILPEPEARQLADYLLEGAKRVGWD